MGSALKCQMVCYVTFLLLFILIFTPSAEGNVDYFGHLGGFLTGIWVTALKEPLINEKRERVIRVVFIALLVVQLTACFLGFFLTDR